MRVIGILILIIALITSCSMGPVAGGTTDTGNSVIAGVVIDTNGNAMAETIVRLLAADYNPVEDSPVPDSMTDTTDVKGCYSFTLLNTTGVYNIEGVHLSQGTKLLITGVHVQGDTTAVQYGILKEPGAIKLFLPDTIDTAGGYLYIEGTTIYNLLSEATPIHDSGYEITLDSVPAGTINAINYGIVSDPSEPVPLTVLVEVSSNEITLVDLLLRWVEYTKDNSQLPGNIINDISLSTDGKIWFATNNGIACIDMINNWTTFDTGNSALPSNSVLDLKHDGDYTWCATSGGVAAYYKDQWTIYNTGNSDIPSNLVTCVDIGNNGNKWFGTLNNGLATFNDTSWIVYDTATSALPSNEVVSVKVDKSGIVWCVTNNGVVEIDGTTWEIYTAGNSGLLSDYVYCMAISNNEDKWFGCHNGVSRFDGSVWTTYDSNNSPILSDSVLSIAEDLFGNIWIGTSNGLTVFTGGKWIDYTGDRYKLLNNKSINSIAFDVSYQNKWIGTSLNGVIAFGPTIK